jgi:hypothetical protein
MRLGPWHAANQVQHLRALDAVELGPELERAQRIEILAAVDFAINPGERGMKQAKRHPRGAQQAFDHLRASGQSVAQGDQTLFGAGLVRALAE